MLHTIHTIAESILIRKSLKWKNCTNTDNTKFDCQQIYNELYLFLSESLTKVIRNKNKTKNIQHYLSNILNLKEAMDTQPWCIPCNIDPKVQQQFLNDLNFYLMLSGILIKARRLFKGFLISTKIPSCMRILPAFSSHAKKMKQKLNLLKNEPWNLIIDNYYLQNNYLKKLCTIQNLCESIPHKHKALLPLDILQEALRNLPTNAHHETILDHHLKDIHNLLIRINDSNHNEDIWNEYRQIISETMVLGCGTKHLCIGYLDFFKDQNSVSSNNLHTEGEFIKTQLCRAKQLHKEGIVKSDTGINLLNHLKIEIIQMAKPSSVKQYIEWNHNPKDFIIQLNQIISKGYLTLKGNNDVQPILEVISQFVKVKKLNNTGNLSYSSLLTYLRKANTGDL